MLFAMLSYRNDYSQQIYTNYLHSNKTEFVLSRSLELAEEETRLLRYGVAHTQQSWPQSYRGSRKGVLSRNGEGREGSLRQGFSNKRIKSWPKMRIRSWPKMRVGKSLKPQTSCGGGSELALGIHSKRLGVSSDPAGVKEGKTAFPPSPCSEGSALAY